MKQTLSREQPGHQSGSLFDFDRMADSYDWWYDTPPGRTYDRLEKRAVDRILPRPAPGALLLDVGCGTGHWSAFFTARGFTVTGVDSAPEMISAARERHLAKALFQVADAHALPFEEGRFDVVAAITALEFVRDPNAVIGEISRCTRRPGGVIIVGVLNALARVNRLRKAADKPPYNAARLFSPRRLREMLEPYGRTQIISAAFVPSSRWLLPVAPVTDAVGRLLRLPHGAFVVGRVRL